MIKAFSQIERLDRIISSYAGDDDELYNQIAKELSDFMHRQNYIKELPGEFLSNEALACYTEWQEQIYKINKITQQ